MNERAATHNIEAEQALLGAILMNNDAYGVVAGSTQAEHFFEPLHQQIYSVIADAIASGRRATPVTLKDYLPQVVVHRAADGHETTAAMYLARLAAESTTIINAPDYAAHVRDMWELRQISAIAANATVSGISPRDAIDRTWSDLDTLRAEANGGNQGEQSSLGQFAAIVAREVENAPSPDAVFVPSTGLSDLDKFIGGGYRPGRLYVFAGRPGMGKTVYAIASSRRVAMKGFGVKFFALEIDGRETAIRAISADLAMGGPVAYSNILSNDLTTVSRVRIKQAAERLAEMPFEVDASGGLTMFEIAARSRITVERWRHRGITPGAIFIDYLGLVTPSDRYRGRRVDEAGEIAKAAKDLAKRLGVGVVLLSQLNRAVEGREDKRPQMSDLRDSGNIEEHADVVGLLYRPAYYDANDPRSRDGDVEFENAKAGRANDLEINLGKNRLGPTRSITLWCDVSSSAVDNQRGR